MPVLYSNCLNKNMNKSMNKMHSSKKIKLIYELYENDGNVNIHYRKPIAYKIKKKYVDFLLQELNKNKTITIEDLLYLLKFASKK